MAYIPDQQINTGSFVPTTQAWDISQIYEIEVGSPEFKDLLVKLYQNMNTIALSLNGKDSGFYMQEEFVTGKTFFNTASVDPNNQRAVFRKVINLGLLAAGAKNVPHGLIIGNTWKFISIFGAANNPSSSIYYPLPYVGIAGNITISLSSSNVIINNTSGNTFTDAYVILEYVKN
jgi:hypothetical protein